MADLSVKYKDKMKVFIRYQAHVNHIRCTNNDANITIEASQGTEPYSYKCIRSSKYSFA